MPSSFETHSTVKRPLAPDLPFMHAARAHPDEIALTVRGRKYFYRDLLSASTSVACFLLGGERADLDEARVVLLVPPGFEFVAAQWGIWRAGGIVVPLALSHPHRELVELMDDAEPELVIIHPGTEKEAIPAAVECGIPYVQVEEALATYPPAYPTLPWLDESRRAHIIFTSGTTGSPKGVVTTHANTRAQAECLTRAWDIGPGDRVLNALPLHHVHGIVNALLCPLWSGARVDILPRFDAREVWNCFEEGGIDVFMGVPTMYVRLIRVWERAPRKTQEAMSSTEGMPPLMISGSAALPVKILERWKEITGRMILERYGLTESGMVISNPRYGERLAGHVGTPLPGVEVRLVRDDGTPAPLGEAGIIEVRGEAVFHEYWRNPRATDEAFPVDDEWFHTGDLAVFDEPAYRILGRKSVDIIKTGGEKVSALEVEEILRQHPRVVDCAVVGIPDEEWGERVCAAVVCSGKVDWTGRLRGWAKKYLAPYKAPSRFLALDELPRNSMGKVMKKEVRHLFHPEPPDPLDAFM